MGYQGKKISDILLNIPNILGYIRLVLFIWGIWEAHRDNYVIAASMYLMNCILDEADGIAARWFGQCSIFGENVDIAIDTACAIMWKSVLCVLYPEYSFYIMLYNGFDLFSDWMFRFSMVTEAMVQGDSYQGSEFTMRNSSNPFMRFYMKSALITDLMIWTYWGFWLTLYLVNYTDGPIVPILNIGLWRVLFWITIPCFINRGFLIRFTKIYMAFQTFCMADIKGKVKQNW